MTKVIYDRNTTSTPVTNVTKLTPIVPFEVGEIIEIVNYVVICGTIAFLGIIANIINIIVYFKHGFNSSINISFFAMAFSDMGCLLIMEFCALCSNPAFNRLESLPFYARDLRYLVGLFSVYFSRVTAWITAYITTERCLMIMKPLKVKGILTPRKTILIIVCIYCVNTAAFVPEYLIASLDWKYVEERNKTLIGIVYVEDKGTAGFLLYILSPLMGLLSLVIVIIFTAILVLKLREKSRWREAITNGQDSVPRRDKRTIKMVVIIACVLLVSYMPGSVLTCVTLFEPEFSALGAYSNLFYVMWSFPFIGQIINSSINIVFYYRLSTSYRETFVKLFHRCTKAA